MSFHRNAKLGLGGCFALVGAIEGGLSIGAAAGRFNVSPATAHRWWRRWREADEESRGTLACLFDRSSRPHRSPRDLADELQERICACRLGTAAGCRCDRLRPLDRLEGAPPGRDLTAIPGREGARQQLRVALSRRSAAHGRHSLRALPAARPRAHRRSLPP
jgi:transposase-like protein